MFWDQSRMYYLMKACFHFSATIEDEVGAPMSVKLGSALTVMYSFWPWIHEDGCIGCEPDVELTIETSEGKKLIIFIEAKYWSGKSSEGSVVSEAPYDQLAREWDNLIKLCARECAQPLFIFLTADLSYPINAIRKSRDDYNRYRTSEMKIYWTCWQKLEKIFTNRKQGASKRDILQDLSAVLRSQGLTFFEGITRPEPYVISWQFDNKKTNVWDWSYDFQPFLWNYSTSQKTLI